MARIIDSATLAQLAAGRVARVEMLLFDFPAPTGQKAYFTGQGSFAWSGITFEGAGNLFALSSIGGVSDGTAVGLAIRLNGDARAGLFANSDLDKPLVITETGADAVVGRDGRPGELFGETHQSDLYGRQLDLVENAPYVRGFCPWILYDFRTERRQTAYQRGWNLKGLTAADKTTRKKAFTTLSERYAELAQQQKPAGA
jgi:hypothetical protein